MKKDIKKLELKKLFKEFSFLKIDEEYKIELQAMYGPEFEKAIQELFKENTDLNMLFNNNASSSTNASFNNESSEKEFSNILGIEIYDPNKPGPIIETGVELYTGKTNNNATENKKNNIIIDEGVKKLYRKIAPKTHPDKVSSKQLNDLYLKAKDAYEKNDIFTLYLICNDLNIDYDFAIGKLAEFKMNIKTLRSKNSMIEQTYLWAWIHEENNEAKKQIIIHFIIHAYKRRF